MISPVQAGGKGSYLASLIPQNAAPLQSGPSFASSDSLAILTQDSTNPFLVTAAVDATDTAPSFNITVSGVNSVGTAISHVFLIPITQAPPPVALDFDLNDAPAAPVATPK